MCKKKVKKTKKTKKVVKKVKPKGSAVSNHLLLCNHSPSFENFSVTETLNLHHYTYSTEYS